MVWIYLYKTNHKIILYLYEHLKDLMNFLGTRILPPTSDVHLPLMENIKAI